MLDEKLKNWLRKEDVWSKILDKVFAEEEKKVKDLEVKAKDKCFVGLCPSIKSHYQLSKKAKKMPPLLMSLSRNDNLRE
ncbi:hypothetical protein V6N12_045551 [Hibiscus sabdariffa]|uniref:Uncharacterized protein n=1 Tax=Hibiscus sabdariffa TaxID=183260 RepID=A0ABR2G365_9ROSI